VAGYYFNPGSKTPIENSDDPVIKKLLASKKSGRSLDIEYKSPNRQKGSKRKIDVKALFFSERYRAEYVETYCHKAKELRIFKVERISIPGSGQQSEPEVASPQTSNSRAICSSEGCSNSAEIRRRKADGTPVYRDTCSGCRKKEGRASPTRAGVKTTSNNRPLCGMPDCSNLAEIRRRMYKQVIYRKLCSGCRRQGREPDVVIELVNLTKIVTHFSEETRTNQRGIVCVTIVR
jgi:hypothetical protein